MRARSKNYMLRTAQETNIIFLFYSMYEIPWMVKRKWSPQHRSTAWMVITPPAIPSTSITHAFFTAAKNVTRSKETWNASAIQTERCMRCTKRPWRKRPYSVTQATMWLKRGDVTLPSKKKQTQSLQNSWKPSNLSRRLSHETHFSEDAPVLRPYTRVFTLQSTNKELILWVSHKLFISLKTRTFTATLVLHKWIFSRWNACYIPSFP